MSSKHSTVATSVAPNTHKLLPLTISAVNIGLALGGTLTVQPLLHPSVTADVVATWFSGFFTPGLITILTIGFSTLAAAVWTLLRATKGRRFWVALGLMFTIAHFGFGPFILGVVERLEQHPSTAKEEIAHWLMLHNTRTVTTDVPAFLCFAKAVVDDFWR